MSTAVKLDQKYTYADYLTWTEDERWELIEGVPYNMSPAPSPEHQAIVSNLNWIFVDFIRVNKGLCQIFPAPFDVRFSADTDDSVSTVVQPDIVVVCDKQKIDDRGCAGAPDLIIEVLSPATAKKDMSEKFDLYEKYLVKEYWMVDPGNKVLHLYQLNEEKKYQLKKIYKKEDKFDVDLFEGLKIDLKDVFTSD